MNKRLQDARQEFNDKIAYDYATLLQLGRQQSTTATGKQSDTSGSAVERINALLGHVTSLRNDLNATLAATQRHLTDYRKILKFKQDANKLELLMQGQEVYLQYEDTGCSATNVEALQKRHEDFLAKLTAQDEKIKQLADQLGKMDNIEGLNEHADVYDMLSERRQRLKAAALERKKALKQSKEFYEFKINCDDLEAWCNERRRLMQVSTSIDDSLTIYQIEKRLKKHEAIESELVANRTRLERLVLDGRALATNATVNKAEICELVNLVERNWRELEFEAVQNGEKLHMTKIRVTCLFIYLFFLFSIFLSLVSLFI